MKHEAYMRQRMEDAAEQAGKEAYGGVDMVNQPPHYNQAGIECIEAIEAALTPEEFRGYCKGNNIKYTWREQYKNGDEDIKKANWYMDRLATYSERLGNR